MSNEFKKNVSEKISKMTLLEKVSQMHNVAKGIKRLDINAYDWWNEALHGVGRSGLATVFPQATAMASTFDSDMIEKVACIVSSEARAIYNKAQSENDFSRYKGLTFWTPNINIYRDPRWGRGQETYGEDPYLTSRMGVAFIKGLQGYDKKYLKVAACAKHFAVHSGPESERHTFDAQPSAFDFYDTYLPAFECAVKEAKVESVMTAYNALYGYPCSCNKNLLEDILRKSWGFEGHVVSDCGAIKDIAFTHKTYPNPADAVAKAVDAGCDLECGFLYPLLTLSKVLKKIDIKTIDKSVERLMMTRAKLGMFDNNCPYDNIKYDIVACKEHEDFAIEVARKSIVLLSNDGILPLDKTQKICVIGPNAKNNQMLLGNYEGTPSSFVNVFDAVQAELGVEVPYASGGNLRHAKLSSDDLNSAIAVAKENDVILLCLGLDAAIEGEEGVPDLFDPNSKSARGDRATISVPKAQLVLIENLLALDKKIVLLNFSGGAVTFGGFEKQANALLQCWYPGAKGGVAISDILFGKTSPSGKLPVTFYQSDADLPPFGDYSMKNRTYRFFEGEAMFPFGFGLTYADIKFDNTKARVDDGIVISSKISNTSNVDTDEVVQIYFSLDTVKGDKPLCALKKFERIHLDPFGKIDFETKIDKSDIFFVDGDGHKIEYTGKIKIFVGNSSPHCLAQGETIFVDFV